MGVYGHLLWVGRGGWRYILGGWVEMSGDEWVWSLVLIKHVMQIVSNLFDSNVISIDILKPSIQTFKMFGGSSV